MSGASPVLTAEVLPSEQSVEAVSDAAVEIATIEAGRDVTIAEIQADTAETAIEADARDDEELTWLRAELDGLRELCVTNAESLSRVSGENETLRADLTTLTETVGQQAAILLTMQPLQQTPEPPSSPEAAPAEPEGVIAEPAAPEAAPQAVAPARKRVWLR